MDWFSVFLNGFGIAAQGILHVGFVCRLTGRRPRPWHFGVYLVLLCGVEGVCTAAGWGTPQAMAAAVLALYAMSRLTLGSRWCFLAAVLAACVFQLSTGVVNSLEALAIPWLERGSLAVYAAISLATLAGPALCAACYGLVLRCFSLDEDAPYWGLPLLPGLFFFAAELYILETAYGRVPVSPERPGKHLALLSLQIMGLAALLCTLYACRRAGRELQAQAALASLEQSVQVQRTYVAEAQARYEQTKSFRHDLQNHLCVLGGLLGTGRTEEARRYLQKLEAVSLALSPPCRTGDTAVDVLLGEKLELARGRGIRAGVSLRLPDDRAVDSFDLCVIFANALDNAIRACGEAKGEAFLRVRGQGQGDFYRLEFENSCVPGPPPKEGTGLANIRAAAGKYGGAVRLGEADGVFRLEVLLNISGQETDLSARKPCNIAAER